MVDAAVIQPGPQASSDGVNPSEPVQLDNEESKCPPCTIGVPLWMATFSDMAILLMAFFVLMLAQTQFEEQNFQKISGSMRAAFGLKTIDLRIKPPLAGALLIDTFSEPDIFVQMSDILRQEARATGGEIPLNNIESVVNKYDAEREFEVLRAFLAPEIELGEAEVKLEDDVLIVEINVSAFSDGSRESLLRQREGIVPQQVIDISERVAQVQSELIREVQVYSVSDVDAESIEAVDNTVGEQFNRLGSNLRSQVQTGAIEIEREDDEIKISIASQGSFRSGGAELTAQFQRLLEEIGGAIVDAGSIRVEGHSDNQPIAFSDAFRSNWDLSAARASAVATALIGMPGLDSERFTIVGFADSVPVASNGTAEGRAQNRRIEIKLSQYGTE